MIPHPGTGDVMAATARRIRAYSLMNGTLFLVLQFIFFLATIRHGTHQLKHLKECFQRGNVFPFERQQGVFQ